MGPGRRPDRLLELSKAVGLDTNNPTIKLHRPARPITTTEQKTRVQEAFLKPRIEHYEKKKTLKFLRHDPNKQAFDISSVGAQEATRVLHELFDTTCSAGEALLLLSLGANVNMARQRSNSMRKKVLGKDQDNVRSDIFQRAVHLGDKDLVNVLADRADVVNLNLGLKTALEDQNTAIIEILMSAGADPNSCQNGFRQAVASDDTKVITLLASGAVGLSSTTANLGLRNMLKRGHSEIVRMLLWHGADADLEFPSILEYATQHGSILDVVNLCSATNAPAPQNLARCVALACKAHDAASPSGLMLIEILLAAGADGEEISSALTTALLRRQYGLVDLIVGYARYEAEKTPDLLMKAILIADIRLFSRVLTLVDSPETLGLLLKFLQSSPVRDEASLDLRVIMTAKIIQRGPTKQAMTTALSFACENAEIAIVRCLAEAGASTDQVTGRNLINAIKQKSMPMLSILLRRKTISLTALNDAMVAVNDVPLILKLEMTRSLLKAGAKGHEVNDALKAAVRNCSSSPADYELIEALLRGGAIVEVDAQSCLVCAVKRADGRAVQLLQPYIPRGSDLEVAVLATHGLRDLDLRYTITQLLLSAGASGLCVTKTLVDVLERYPREKRFTRLIAAKGKPNINLCGGRALSLAIGHHDIELFRMLMKMAPSTDTLNDAMRTATTLEEGRMKLETCQLLLEAGAKGDQVAEALLRAAMSFPPEMDLVKLLVSFGASVDHKSGNVLCIALDSQRVDIELLKVLLQQPAQLSTMNRALGQALNLSNTDQKFKAVQTILGANTKIPGDNLGPLLAKALGDGQDLRLLLMLLKSGASVNVGSLEVFQKAINMNDAASMIVLMAADPTESTVRQVFECAWKARANNGFAIPTIIAKDPSRRQSIALDDYLIRVVDEVAPSKPAIDFLLKWGASPAASTGRSIQICVERNNSATLGMLLAESKKPKLPASVFKVALKHPALWVDEATLQTTYLLLQHCPWQKVLDKTLLDTIIHFESRKNAARIVNYLLACKASCNYNDGEALKEAVKRGYATLVDQLLTTKPVSSTINDAFPLIFASSVVGHDKVMQMIRSFTKKTEKKLDLNKLRREHAPVLFLCYLRKDTSVAMMEELISSGASMAATIPTPGNRVDNYTILMYAIHLAKTAAHMAIVSLLIQRGANVNAVATSSGTTPLMIAARAGRQTIVQQLIEHGAKTTTKDLAGCTPLWWAVEKVHLTIMEMLIQARAPTDDGSLHRAISAGEIEATSMLLDAGHGPNFPCPRYDLQAGIEIALRNSHGYTEPETLKSMLKLLHKHHANPRYRKDGKSLLIMALDLENATKVIRPLLSAFMGSMVNEEFNRFHEQSLIYSPLSYVAQNKAKSPASMKNELLETLKSYGCDEVYYHESGPQPEGYKGAPKHLIKRERERLERLQLETEKRVQHEAELARIKELTGAQLEAQKQEAALKLESEREFTRLLSARNREVEAALERQNTIQMRAMKKQLALRDSYEAKSYQRHLQIAASSQQLLAGSQFQVYNQAYLPVGSRMQRQIGYVEEAG